MATIRERKQADGSTRYAAYARIVKRTLVIHTEAKTFTRRSAAETWARRRLRFQRRKSQRNFAITAFAIGA